MSYTIYNVQAFVTAKIDEEEGQIVLEMAGTDKLLVIDKEDELYEYHLTNMRRSRDQIIEAYGTKEENTSN